MGGASSKAKDKRARELHPPEPEPRVEAAAAVQPLCPHARPITAKAFRKTLRRRFPTVAPAADDSSSDDEAGLGPTDSTETLRCDECGSEENVWLCMHCGKLLCLQEDSKHACAHADRSCNVMLSCLDSHVYCCGCEKYLYPREVSGRDDDEDAMGPHIAAWLQILGRYRQWWRDAGGSTGLPEGGCHGLPNFGNTCFFTATIQALVHSQPLAKQLAPAPVVVVPPPGAKRSRQGGVCQGGSANSPVDTRRSTGEANVKPIHRELWKLASLYWNTQASPPRTPAAANFAKQTKALWEAVAEHALYGEYDEASMEDANTLLQDLFCGLDEATTDQVCGVGIESRIDCMICSRRIANTSRMLHRLFRTHPDGSRLGEALWRMIGAGVIGQLKPRVDGVETVLTIPVDSPGTPNGLSLPLEDSEPPVPPAAGSADPRYTAMAIGAGIGGGADGAAVGLDELLTNHFATEWLNDYKCEFCNNRADLPPPLPSSTSASESEQAERTNASDEQEQHETIERPTCTYRVRLAGAGPPLLVLQLKRFASLDSAALAISTATGGLDSCRAKSHRKVKWQSLSLSRCEFSLPIFLSRDGSRMVAIVACSRADGNHRTCLQVVAPLQLDLGRFAEFDDQPSLGDGSSSVPGVGQSGYMYTLCAIVVHDGGMCVASIVSIVLAGVCQQQIDGATLSLPFLIR